MSAFYPNPWKGGWWRLKDAVDYCLTASRAVLDVASKYREELLFNKYKMGKDVINRFSKEPPHAWIIPVNQRDPKVKTLSLKPVRLGMYKSWLASADEGWTRLILEKYEFPYSSIHDADIRAEKISMRTMMPSLCPTLTDLKR